MTTEPKGELTISVPESLRQRLITEAKSRKISVAELVRQKLDATTLGAPPANPRPKARRTRKPAGDHPWRARGRASKAEVDARKKGEGW